MYQGEVFVKIRNVEFNLDLKWIQVRYGMEVGIVIHNAVL